MFIRQPQSDERMSGSASHCSDVGERSRDGLAPNHLRRCVGFEMDALNDGIGFEQAVVAGYAQVDHGTVVTGANDYGIFSIQPGGEAGD